MSSRASDILNTKIINIKYKILFHVRFPTLHLLREKEIKRLKKILVNSIENTDVLFKHSDVKVYVKRGFIINELFKERCTESNVVKRVLRAIEG